MGSSLSDQQRSRLADRSRRRSLWLLLVLTAMLVAFGLFVPLAVASADGRTLDIRAVVRRFLANRPGRAA
ncbi:MAG TPA: hypothetical protein VHN18_00380 [Micromonosporaceae bacterium]|nr:hypothetical protein [Micromonosporaceae bacterium]